MSKYKSGVLFTVVGALLWGISGTSGQFLLQQRGLTSGWLVAADLPRITPGAGPVRGFVPVLLPIYLVCDHQPFECGNGNGSAIFGPGPYHGLSFRQEKKIAADY